MKYVADVHVSHASKCCRLVNFFCSAVIRSKSLFDTKNVLAKLKTFTLFFAFPHLQILTKAKKIYIVCR